MESFTPICSSTGRLALGYGSRIIDFRCFPILNLLGQEGDDVENFDIIPRVAFKFQALEVGDALGTRG